MSIHDDCFGSGENLAFPTMSSCSACICVLDDRLVGVHKTQGWHQNTHDSLFKFARKSIGTAKVHGLYVAGWNAGSDQHHDLGTISQKFGLTGTRKAPIWVFDYKNASIKAPSGNKSDAFKPGVLNNKMSDLCTFAFRDGTQAPKVGVKRTTKVTVHQLDEFSSKRKDDRHRFGMTQRESFMLSYPENLETPSNHLHYVNFESFS